MVNEINKAIESKSTVAVKFSAPWCGPCKAYAPVFREFIEETNITGFDVDIEERKDLTEEFKIKSIPTTIIFKNGKEINRLNGIVNKKDLMEVIENV